MAASPGFRMGVPASMPKTPMLVMEMVPPGELGRSGLARARRVRQLGQRRGELQQGHPVGVLDVRHGQAARRGGRDAQVHVVVLDDLLLGLVPAGVERGVVAQGDEHGLGHDGQRRELVAGKRAAGLELRQQFHGRGDVDGQELRDVRCGEGAGNHGGGGELPYALDRRPGFPLALRRSLRGHTGQVLRCHRQVSPADEVAHVVAGDEPVLPGAGDGREVDAEILGQLAHRRRGPRAFRGLAARRPAPTTGAARPARPPGRARPAQPPERARQRKPPGRRSCGRGGPDGRNSPGRRRSQRGSVRAWRARPHRHLRSSGTAGGTAVVALHLEGNDRLADLHDGAGLFVQGRDHTGERRGKLDDGLGRFDLRDDLVERDGVPHRDLPRDDFRFSETLTEVRQPEFLDHGGAHPSSPLRELGRPRARSTPSRIRSRPGRWCISSFEYGYGTSKPVTRTGAASRW